MMRTAVIMLVCFLSIPVCNAQLTLRPDIDMPELPAFTPLPSPDPEFNALITKLVKETRLDEITPASQNPDKHDEWSSVCVVDISDIDHPRVGGWKQDNFVYPASTYKLYILGEAIRQVVEGSISLDDVLTVKEHNVRSNSRLEAGQQVSISEVLRLMMMYSDNTAANEAIDLVDRQRASALLRAMGCKGSDITRKYLPRTLEDDDYTTVPGTTSSALHFATFLWAMETSAIGGGQGRGLIKAYMGMIATAQERFRAGIPSGATLYSKSGTWNTFTSQVGIIEDGTLRYIACVLTALPNPQADPRIAAFIRHLHKELKHKHN